MSRGLAFISESQPAWSRHARPAPRHDPAAYRASCDREGLPDRMMLLAKTGRREGARATAIATRPGRSRRRDPVTCCCCPDESRRPECRPVRSRPGWRAAPRRKKRQAASPHMADASRSRGRSRIPFRPHTKPPGFCGEVWPRRRRGKGDCQHAPVATRSCRKQPVQPVRLACIRNGNGAARGDHILRPPGRNSPVAGYHTRRRR